MKEFKVGDKVYSPKNSNKILLVGENKCGSENYPLAVGGFSFTTDGKHLTYDKTPSVFHATPENRELLEKLYSVEFEKPPVKPTPKEVIKALLDKGYDNIPCWVSNDFKQPTHEDKWVFITYYNDTTHSDSPYTDSVGYDWKYATPFDINTGKAIIDFNPETGEIVTE